VNTFRIVGSLVDSLVDCKDDSYWLMMAISKVEDVLEVVLKKIIRLRDETTGCLMSKIVRKLCKMELQPIIQASSFKDNFPVSFHFFDLTSSQHCIDLLF
jgi:uncharacterized protein YtpQ (UPF0354 family)